MMRTLFDVYPTDGGSLLLSILSSTCGTFMLDDITLKERIDFLSNCEIVISVSTVHIYKYSATVSLRGEHEGC